MKLEVSRSRSLDHGNAIKLIRQASFSLPKSPYPLNYAHNVNENKVQCYDFIFGLEKFESFTTFRSKISLNDSLEVSLCTLK